MRYQIVKDGKVMMTAPDLDTAIKVLDALPAGYQIELITKAEHSKIFNLGSMVTRFTSTWEADNES
jgi:hypothetical protein